MTPVHLVCCQTYSRQECVVALQQQCAQLRPAQTLQLMLFQCPHIQGRVQRVGEAASSPVKNKPNIVQS